MIEDSGSLVATYSSRRKDAAEPIVLLGGLGSSPEKLRPIAYHLHKESRRDVSVVDVSRDESLRAIDERSLGKVRLLAIDAIRKMMMLGDNSVSAFDMLTPFNIKHYAELANEKIDKHVTTGEIDIVSHSWGGVLAEKMLTSEPINQRIGRAALLATVAGAAMRPNELLSPRTIIKMSNPDTSPERMLRDGGDLFGGDVRENPEIIITAGLRNDVDPEAYRRQVRCYISSTAIRASLGDIKQPVLVMGGGDDPITPLPNSIALHDALPNSRLVIVPNGGHMFPFTRTRETAMTVAEFFEQYKAA